MTLIATDEDEDDGEVVVDQVWPLYCKNVRHVVAMMFSSSSFPINAREVEMRGERESLRERREEKEEREEGEERERRERREERERRERRERI